MAITKIQCLNEAHTGNPAAHLKNALSYIQNPEKTEENVMVGSINCLPDTAFEQMMDTKVTFGKTNKRQGYHIIISFAPGDMRCIMIKSICMGTLFSIASVLKLV